MEGPKFEYRAKLDMFLFFKMSRQALGHVRASIRGAGFFPGKKAPGASSYLHAVQRLRMDGAKPLFPLQASYVDRENVAF